jgi:hypothetical protein
MTNGSTSYSTSIRSSASSAIACVVAATAATAWPVIQHLVARHDVARQVAEVHRAFADERFLVRDVREIRRRHDRLDAGQRLAFDVSILTRSARARAGCA